MNGDFNRDKPIYTQLIERICREILRKELVAGQRLPSVREYALDVGVNVNTVQRVYKELEKMNLTDTKRGQGSFITQNNEYINDLKEKMKVDFIQQFFKDLQEFGFSKEEIIHEINQYGGDYSD